MESVLAAKPESDTPKPPSLEERARLKLVMKGGRAFTNTLQG